MRQEANNRHTHMHTYTRTHTHTHTSSSCHLAHKGRRTGPRQYYCLGPVSEAQRLSQGWAGQAHAQQSWGEWQLRAKVVEKTVEARQVDRSP